MRFLLATILLCWSAAEAENSKTEIAKEVEHYLASTEELPEVQVTATRVARDPFDTPRAITMISREEVARRRAPVAIEALDTHPGLWVEHRTGTTADPIMRGFSGANLLALIDGNTLTTLWGEGGYGSDDMYGKLDPYLVDRIEVVRGPTSVLYGSNNLGGVIQFLTRSSRYDYTEQGFAYGGRLFLDFTGVNSGVRGRLEHHGASPTWRWLLGFSAADQGDVRGGGDVGIEKPTSGKEKSFDLKAQHRVGEEHEFELFLQRMDRNKTNRFYRPTQTNNNDRVAFGLTYRTTALGPWAENFEARFYHQYKKDVRFFFDSNRRGIAKTKTYVLAAQASTAPGRHRLTYGISWEHDDGEDPDDEQFTLHTAHMDDVVKDAPDSTWDDLGVYVQWEWEIGPKWSLVSAARLDYFRFQTHVDRFYDPPGPLDPADDQFTDTVFAPTGGTGLVYRASDGVHLLADVSTGFRQFAPNFGARQRAAGILMPNRLLDPITALSMEVGAKIRQPTWWLDAFFYRTELFNWQNERFGSFDGSDFFDFNQNGVFDPEERVIVTVGNGRAYVTGIEIEGALQIGELFDAVPEGFSLHGGFAWNYGNDRTNKEPFRFVHPAHAIVTLRYESRDGRWWAELTSTMVRHAGRVPSDRINDPGFHVNPQDVTSPLIRSDLSLPGYAVFDLRGGYRIHENARVELAVENLADRKYRSLHSRMDAAGFGIRVGITVDF